MVTSCCCVYKDSMCPVWPEVSMDDRIKKGKHGGNNEDLKLIVTAGDRLTMCPRQGCSHAIFQDADANGQSAGKTPRRKG